MKKIIHGKKIFFSALFLVITFLLFPSVVFAGWYFNWSCWRSSGRQGPYATRSACESELSRARNACAGGSKFSSTGCSGFDDYTPPARSPQQTPPDQGWQIQRRKEEQERKEAEERKQRQLQEAAEEQNRREQEAARKFSEDKEQTLKNLKGGSDTLTIKGGTDVFELKGNPDVEMKLPGAERPAVTSAWKQLHCSAYISGFAFKAAVGVANNKGTDIRDPDWDEIHYLAGEANKALSGEPMGVQCPEAPQPPKPYSQVKLGPDSTVVKFYRILLRATQQQSARADKAEKKIRDATAKKQAARVEVEKKEKEVVKLQEEIKKEDKEPLAPNTENEMKEKDAQVKNEEKRRALADALAALSASKQAKEKVDKLSDEAITSATKEKTEAQALLGQFEKLFNQVQADPSKASEYLNMIQK